MVIRDKQSWEGLYLNIKMIERWYWIALHNEMPYSHSTHNRIQMQDLVVNNLRNTNAMWTLYFEQENITFRRKPHKIHWGKSGLYSVKILRLLLFFTYQKSH